MVSHQVLQRKKTQDYLGGVFNEAGEACFTHLTCQVWATLKEDGAGKAHQDVHTENTFGGEPGMQLECRLQEDGPCLRVARGKIHKRVLAKVRFIRVSFDQAERYGNQCLKL